LSQENLLIEKDQLVKSLTKSLNENSDFSQNNKYEEISHLKHVEILKSEIETLKSTILLGDAHKRFLDENFLQIFEKKILQVDQEYFAGAQGMGDGQGGSDPIEGLLNFRGRNESYAGGEEGDSLSRKDFGLGDEDSQKLPEVSLTGNLENKMFLFDSVGSCLNEFKRILEEKCAGMSLLITENSEQEKEFSKERSQFEKLEKKLLSEVDALKKSNLEKNSQLQVYEAGLYDSSENSGILANLLEFDTSTLGEMLVKERNEKLILLTRLGELKSSNLEMSKQLLKNGDEYSSRVLDFNQLVDGYKSLEVTCESTKSQFQNDLDSALKEKNRELEIQKKLQLKFLQEVTVLSYENEKLRNYIRVNNKKVVPALDTKNFSDKIEFLGPEDQSLFYSIKDLADHNCKLRTLLYNIRNQELTQTQDGNSSSFAARGKFTSTLDGLTDKRGSSSCVGHPGEASTKEMIKLLNKLESEVKSWETKYENLTVKSTKLVQETQSLEKSLSI
jgi:hypothetical protein